MTFSPLEHVSRIADLLLVLGPLLLWGRKWANRIEATYQSARDVTLTHLPFIYARLHTHATSLGIDPVDHPNILQVNGTVAPKGKR